MDRRVKVVILMVMMMVVMMVMGCNSGGVAGGEGAAGGGGRGGSLSEVLLEVGRSAENAFYAFIELMSDTLGLRVTQDTKKNAVGEYFNNLGDKLGKASDELEQVAVKSEANVDKDVLLSKAIKEVVNAAKTTLNKLKENLESLKDIGDANQKVGVATSNSQGAKPDDGELKKAYKAFKGIVEEAGKVGVEKLEVGNTTLNNAKDNKEGAKILSTNDSDKPSSADDSGKAAAILLTVSGKEMLASIVESKEGDQALSVNADGSTTAMSFARGTNGNHLGQAHTPKAAALAAGIALRSLIKTGTLASHSGKDNEAAQAIGVSATNKLLRALEDIIKKTVKNVLEKVKEEVDKAREPKAAVK
ncbi:variable large family protein [Borrelia crocidurae]|uniref:Variable large protein n=1 Tax=Borrelia crocidurae (strain Achema) TaxID=1155096 RepID=I0FF25_BORCA|nr:variable large family protein [Borrelia crocidurae]AFI32081.1 VlpA18D [Borrelia crocidurae str. Achema]